VAEQPSFFACLVQNYVGIDYSSTMIIECKKKYPEREFRVVDARNLSCFEDNYFDLVLFSFNGIDYMNFEDRLRSLKEIKRVTKENGYFCFSTHNLNYAPELLKVRFPKSLEALMFEPIRLYRFYNLHINIKNESKNVPYMILNDGAHNFKLLTFYIKPEEQVRQLLNMGFEKVTVFGSNGKEIIPQEIANIKDWYPYYLFKKPKNNME